MDILTTKIKRYKSTVSNHRLTVLINVKGDATFTAGGVDISPSDCINLAEALIKAYSGIGVERDKAL
jgi:hypothetical protein